MTAKERAYHYKRALKMLQTGTFPKDIELNVRDGWIKNGSGMCELISLSHSKFYPDMCTESDFPEFFMFKPERVSGEFWFDKHDRALRETILAFCIEITE